MNNKAIKAFVQKFKGAKCPDFRLDLINDLFHDWAGNLDNIGTKEYDNIWYQINQKLPFFCDGYFLSNDAWIDYVAQQTINIAKQAGTEIPEDFIKDTERSLLDADAYIELPSLVLADD